MNVTETQIDDLTRQFRVTMPAADIERKVEARLGELAQTMRLPGFRPGKVPLGLMRKRYGAAVKSEVVEQTINESSQAVISERGLRAALPPKVELADLPDTGDLEYTLAVELLPEITPPDYAQISLERLTATVDEAEIERRIGRFADAVGEETVASGDRQAADGDIVVFDLLGRPSDPWPFNPENLSGIRLRIGSNAPLPGFDSQLVGLAAGARATVSITVPEGTDRADLAGQTRSYEIEVKEVRTRTPAPIDDELAKKGGWESLEDLKKWLREQHENELKSLSRLRLKRSLLDRLSELYDFAVPNGLLQREYESLARQHQPAGEAAAPAAPEEHVHDEHCGHDHEHGATHEHAPAADAALSEAQRAEYKSLALRRVRLGLVLAEIGRSNNLRVQQDELAKAMIAHARRFTGQEQAVLEFLRKNPEAQEALAAPILEEKVVDFILEMAKVGDRTVDPSELLRDADDETTSATDVEAART
ncbi:MAG: trigger factor [Rhodospirillales bacterium]|nr:trigger factor [Rhodospirillales bacterium]